MIITWSPFAIERAYEEARHITDDKPKATLHWLEGLFETIDRLEHFPDSGRPVPEIRLPAIRELIYNRTHRIVYLRSENRVSILTIRRARQPLQMSEIVSALR